MLIDFDRFSECWAWAIHSRRVRVFQTRDRHRHGLQRQEVGGHLRLPAGDEDRVLRGGLSWLLRPTFRQDFRRPRWKRRSGKKDLFGKCSRGLNAVGMRSNLGPMLYQCAFFGASPSGLQVFNRRAVVVDQVVAHREAPSSIPTGSWAFFFLSLSYLSISGASLNRSHVEVQDYWLSNFQQKWRLRCAAEWATETFWHKLRQDKSINGTWVMPPARFELMPASPSWDSWSTGYTIYC